MEQLDLLDVHRFTREKGVPVRGRMIHPPPKQRGKPAAMYPVPYGDTAYSVGRTDLNELLLDGEAGH